MKNFSANKAEKRGNPVMLRMMQTVLIALVWLPASVFAATLQDVQFSSLPGDGTEIRLSFDSEIQPPKGYAIEQPARIVLDLEGVTNGLAEKTHQISEGNTESLTVLEAGSKTRLIVNLRKLMPHATRMDGQTLVVSIGKEAPGKQVVASAGADQSRSAASAGISAADEGSKAPADKRPGIRDIDFQRGPRGDGRVVVNLGQSSGNVDMSEEGGRVKLTFRNAFLPEELRRRLDVTDFATPVSIVDSFVENGNAVILVKPEGSYDYLAYQTEDTFTLAVEPVSESEAEQRKQEKFPYSGEKLTLNFQDIEVRLVLQLIANVAGLNLVASDTVAGRITLRLQNVPWDQALELVLKTKGLDKRKVGNVLLVAPAAEIAAREKLELEANRQVRELAPVRLEVIQVNYAKAADIVSLLQTDKDLISGRGFISSDQRTNTISLRETGEKIDQVRRLIDIWDRPVSQVLIEARIVRARTDAVEDLGVAWGVQAAKLDGENAFLVGGSRNTVGELGEAIGYPVQGAGPREGESVGGPVGLLIDEIDITYPDALSVDLGISRASSSSIGIGFRRDNIALDLELSAFESDGKGEVVAQPKVITADRQTARIESGEEIPYQEASSSGATSVSFKKAVLSLEVTPQITPDDKIIMDLAVNQDSRGSVTNGIPSISTNSVETQVLVGNGETVVLGGIFTSDVSETITKTPFLGDIPYLGRLFRKTESTDQRSELLIFITPRLVSSDLTDNR